jgi:hypothetical protein
MQIPVGLFLLIFMLLSMTLIAAVLVTHDRIIRYICLRDGWRYPVLWFLRPSWVLRLSLWAWLEAAKSAGYLKLELALFVLWICVIVGAGVLAAGGFVESRPPLIQR